MTQLLNPELTVEISHRDIKTNGVTLHVVEAGDENAPLIILLHGFPEFWYGWRRQIGALVNAGFRVLAPDQRGYNLSDKPTDVAQYSLDRLSDDVIGLIDATGREQAFVVGHDWGAAVAWWTAMRYPSRVARLAILNVSHPSIMVKNVRANPAQMLKSWYIGFFQVPFLPELLLTAGDAQNGIAMLQKTSNPGSFTDADVPFYVQAWKQPGAMRSMINWYRAAVQRPSEVPADRRIHMPTLILWGKNDAALTPEMAEQSLNYCDDGRLVMYDDASHWVQHDKPAEVNAQLINFFSNE